MSEREPINLTALREQYADPGDDPGMREDAQRVLALIDAVEAARDALWDTTRHGEQTRTRLAEALERFTP